MTDFRASLGHWDYKVYLRTRVWLPFLFLFCFLKDFIYLFLETGEETEKERERNTDVQEKHRSVASHMSSTQGCALTENRMGGLMLCGMTPNSLSHTSEGYSLDVVYSLNVVCSQAAMEELSGIENI